MAVGSKAQQLLVNTISRPIGHCRPRPVLGLDVARNLYSRSHVSQINIPAVQIVFDKTKKYKFVCRNLHSSCRASAAHPRLSPQEVTNILRANEYSQELNLPEPVKSYDSNQLPSNNPIEDTRCEGRCLLTTGMLFGIFDGHGGPSCAQVIAKRMLNYITVGLLPDDLLCKYHETLQRNESMELLQMFNNNLELVDKLKLLYDKSLQNFVTELTQLDRRDFQMKKAMENAFLRLDEDLSREALPGEDGHVNKKTLSVAMSGAVACVAHVDGPHLHIASTGDCQAVLGVLSDVNTWSAKKLTTEHNTENQSEVQRILSEHPCNERDTVIKMERLLGQLAPLRALGDFKYKWSKERLVKLVLPYFGEQHMPPNYYTPPYLTARPDVTHHRLRPRDKFLVIASDGLWDVISPLQVVRLVGEHMSGKVILSPFRIPRKNMRIADINKMLLHRKEGLTKKPIDSNAATHLLRNALGGTEYGIDHGKISQLLSLPQEIVRLFRDDITITVVYFDSEYLRHCPK